jgi:hypothetical protein
VGDRIRLLPVETTAIRLAHGWRVSHPAPAKALARDWIRPAVRALPKSIAVRLPPCAVTLEDAVRLRAASRWTLSTHHLDIAIGFGDAEPHDVSMELLVCIGQAVWDVLSALECDGWLAILRAEIDGNVTGEIDEDALAAKRALFSDAVSARSPRRLTAYARASFAGTLAEYVHSLWHDVTIRSGPDHLPAAILRRRLEKMELWFPPNPGCHLFPDRSR